MSKPADTIKPAEIIRLYPNPARDKLLLEWQSAASENATLTIEDLLGRNIAIQAVSSNMGPQNIDISRLTNGTYVIWVKEAGHVVYQAKEVIIK